MAKPAPSCSRTKLDQILDHVTQQQGEVTIDAADCTREQVDRIYATAKARGLHASGTNRWILIRPPLRYVGGVSRISKRRARRKKGTR